MGFISPLAQVQAFRRADACEFEHDGSPFAPIPGLLNLHAFPSHFSLVAHPWNGVQNRQGELSGTPYSLMGIHSSLEVCLDRYGRSPCCVPVDKLAPPIWRLARQDTRNTIWAFLDLFSPQLRHRHKLYRSRTNTTSHLFE